MNENGPQPDFDPDLEASLDRVPTNDSQALPTASHQERPELAHERQLQDRVDEALRKLFRPPTACEPPSGLIPPMRIVEHLVVPKPATDSRSGSAAKSRSRLGLAALCAIAAGIAWLLVGQPFLQPSIDKPVFRPEPLIGIYRTTLQHGFRPYYECHDLERFAATFQQRQGTALTLCAMPTGRRMLGLSYLGGLSRDTTAMLGTVDRAPVIVFVDRRIHDQVIATEGSAMLGATTIPSDRSQGLSDQDLRRIEQGQAPLFVFRKELDDLILYEVTPWREPGMLDKLLVLSSDAQPSVPGDKD